MQEKEIYGTVGELLDQIEWLQETADLIFQRLCATRLDVLRERDLENRGKLDVREELMMDFAASIGSYSTKITELYPPEAIEADKKEAIEELQFDEDKERARQSFGNIERGLLTLADEYFSTILLFLAKQSEPVKRIKILAAIESSFADRFTAADKSFSTSVRFRDIASSARWTHQVSNALSILKSKGLVDQKTWGYWSITDEGRKQVNGEN